MRISSHIPAILALIAAAILSVAVATMAVTRVERASYESVDRALMMDGQTWATVSVDGLMVHLSGTAPDEATRFRALKAAGSAVDAARVIDDMEVTASEQIEAPRFSIEILRNDSGISLIGLVPSSMDRARLIQRVNDLAGDALVTDLLEVSDFPAPEGWKRSVDFALRALKQLPRSKVSVSADAIEITAIADNGPAKRLLENDLRKDAPEGARLTLNISAPRPVISPFTLRFVIDERGPRFDACSAETPEARDRILAAARDAGLAGPADCVLGLGVPSPRWADAATASIAALAKLGGGTLTISNADVSLVAPETADQEAFDRVTEELRAKLPPVFSLTATKPEPVAIVGTGAEPDKGPPEFVATLSPEGLLQLRGRIADERMSRAAAGFARVHFAGVEVVESTRIDKNLPDGWARRVFAGLEALSYLSHGALVVQPAFVDIRGATGNPDARAEIARILSSQLGEASNFAIAVEYVEALDPTASLPTPEECVSRINEILAENKVTFEPGSAEIEAGSRKTIDRIADVMKQCDTVPMEIAGHTDSQGRESMNLSLSQQRADAVLVALQARRVLTGNLRAKGYGEARPIADNDTEEGREANRRIEFTLIEPEAEAEDEAATEEAAADETADPADEPAPNADAQTESASE